MYMHRILCVAIACIATCAYAHLHLPASTSFYNSEVGWTQVALEAASRSMADERKDPVIEKGMTLDQVYVLIGDYDEKIEDGKGLFHLEYIYWERSAVLIGSAEKCYVRIYFSYNEQLKKWIVYKVIGDSNAYHSAYMDSKTGERGTYYIN